MNRPWRNWSGLIWWDARLSIIFFISQYIFDDSHAESHDQLEPSGPIDLSSCSEACSVKSTDERPFFCQVCPWTPISYCFISLLRLHQLFEMAENDPPRKILRPGWCPLYIEFIPRTPGRMPLQPTRCKLCRKKPRCLYRWNVKPI